MNKKKNNDNQYTNPYFFSLLPNLKHRNCFAFKKRVNKNKLHDSSKKRDSYKERGSSNSSSKKYKKRSKK